MVTLKPLLTSRELADAIGASESSLRRWIDGGDIRVSRTAGGHRRIALPDAIAFVRRMGATVVRPEILGLGDGPLTIASPDGVSDEQKLVEALTSANPVAAARSLVISWYLNGRTLSWIFDGPMRAALATLGERWKHDEGAILLEHTATGACIEAIAMLRSLIAESKPDAPLAVGGSPQGDPYLIPSQMVAAVLAEAGWRATNFGPGTPTQLLAKAAIERQADLAWLSVSAVDDPSELPTEIRKLAQALDEQGITLVLGGRYSDAVRPPSAGNVVTAPSMEAFSEIVRKRITPNKSSCAKPCRVTG